MIDGAVVRAFSRLGLLDSFDVTGDGERFLLTLNPREDSDGSAAPGLTVVANWQAALRR